MPFQIKTSKQKLEKRHNVEYPSNKFMVSVLNDNFTITNVICHFFPQPITKIPTKVKRMEK